MTFPPELSALMAQYRDTAAGLGHNHPITQRLWLLVEATAPDCFREIMDNTANELGLLPTPRHCDANGQPLYSLDEIGARLGTTPEEMRRAWAQLAANREAIGLPVEDLTAAPATDLHALN